MVQAVAEDGLEGRGKEEKRDPPKATSLKSGPPKCLFLNADPPGIPTKKADPPDILPQKTFENNGVLYQKVCLLNQTFKTFDNTF